MELAYKFVAVRKYELPMDPILFAIPYVAIVAAAIREVDLPVNKFAIIKGASVSSAFICPYTLAFGLVAL